MTVPDKVIVGAAERYGYLPSQVQLRFYVGKFAGRQGADKPRSNSGAPNSMLVAGRSPLVHQAGASAEGWTRRYTPTPNRASSTAPSPATG